MILLLLTFQVNSAWAAEVCENEEYSATCLFGWNEGLGTDWPGWTWGEDVTGYGDEGWTKDDGKKYSNGWAPKSFEMNGHPSNTLAEIYTGDRAPSTSAGGSFRLYEDPIEYTEDWNRWWVWYDGVGFGQNGNANSDTDRMDFYMKVKNIKPLDDTGDYDSRQNFPNHNFHVGTYLCWNDGSPVYGQGSG